MRFTPKYHVIYNGSLRSPGVPFDIDPKDADEMRRHGTVEAGAETLPLAEETKPAPAPRRGGRPRRTQD